MYEFSFGISVTLDAAKRLKKLIQDEDEMYVGNGRVVKDSLLFLFLDGELRTNPLYIDADFKREVRTEISIEGEKPTKEEAKKEMRLLQTILSSGALPVKLKITSVESIPPAFGERFLHEVLIIGIIAEILVITVVFLRYRNIKITVPMILISASEVVIILGIASLIGWTIDLPSLAGIIAILGTGVDAQIMIIDEVLSGKRMRIYSVTEKIKRAFFIIFSSAATTFVAMLPLLSAGAKVMQGFAVTTIIGLFIAVFVTRPAFGRIVEEIA
jgi:preprotein translocase subunit SecD